MKLRFGGIVLVTLMILMAATAVWAQGTTGGLSGKVVDEKGQPIPGAVISITSRYMQGSKGAASNLDGEYTVLFLPPGNDYKVTIEAPNFNKVIQSNVTINLGSTTTLETALTGGGTEVSVTARPPAVTLKETKVSTNMTQEEMEMLPLGRSYQDILSLAPQVAPSGAGGNPAVAGGNSTDNVWVVNGLNTTDPVTGTFGNNLNFNFIREMEVSTGGFDAEYGTSTGGMFNVLTKAGTNEFHGEVFGYYTNQSMTSKSHSTDTSVAQDQPFHEYDYGFDIGGPIIKDRLWFFVAYNPTDNSYTQQGTLQNQSISNPYMPLDTQYESYNYNDWRRTWSWSSKFNFRINDKHNLELAVFSDPSHFWDSEGWSPSLYTQTSQNKRFQNGYSAILRWYATWTPNLYMETNIGYGDNTLQIQPWDMSTLQYKSVQSADYAYGLYLTPGNQSTFDMDDRATNQAQIKLTWVLGKHEVKFGGELYDQKWHNFNDYSGGQYIQTLYNLHGAVEASPNISDYYYHWVDWNQNPRYSEHANYYAGYLQDKWGVLDNLELVAGMRYEKNEMQPGSGQTLNLDSWSPRIGLSWDWAKNGKSKFYVHYGNYYNRPPMGFLTSMDAGHAFYQARYSHYGTTHDYTTVSGDIPTTAYPGLRPEYQTELIVGNTYELRPDLTLDVRYTNRQQQRLLEDMGFVTPGGDYQYYLMNPGTAPWPAQFDSWKNVIPDYERFPHPIHHYQALTFALNKRFSNHWLLNASYTWSQLVGNYDNDAYGYSSPGGTHVSTLYDVPEHLLIQNQYGPLSGDRPHMVKVQGAYKFDNGLVLGSNFALQSGRPMYHLMGYPRLAQYGYGTIMMQSRESATRMPTTWSLDVHAEYNFKISKTDLGLFADIFNLTNNQAQTAYYSSYYLTPDTYSQIFKGQLTRDPNWGKTTGRQSPRYARIGVKWSF